MSKSRYDHTPIRAARRARGLQLQHRYVTVLKCEHGHILYDQLEQAYIFVTHPPVVQLELDLGPRS